MNRKLIHPLNRSLLLDSIYNSGSIIPSVRFKRSSKIQKRIKFAVKNARILGIIKTSYTK